LPKHNSPLQVLTKPKVLQQEDPMADPATSSPLLDNHEGWEDERGRRSRSSTLVQKVIDVEEAKAQMIYSLPMILTNVFYYCIPITSVMFASHLGQLELAGATLANSWATVSGFAFMVPLFPFFFSFCNSKSCFDVYLHKLLKPTYFHLNNRLELEFKNQDCLN